ncbi:hypothetical protein C8Q79DRAFT_1122980 [Trametes meyenii]|nr:hypothetical protein C8Q79DRAFT_1122980 [Trametes meyenii]
MQNVKSFPPAIGSSTRYLPNDVIRREGAAVSLGQFNVLGRPQPSVPSMRNRETEASIARVSKSSKQEEQSRPGAPPTTQSVSHPASPLQQLEVPPRPQQSGRPLPAKGQVFRVPLRNNTDPDFMIDLTIRGKPGIPARVRGLSGYKPTTVNPAVKEVDGADKCIDDFFPSMMVCCVRAYLGEEPKPTAAQRETEKIPREGFTLGHLITYLLFKQHARWLELKFLRTMDLRYVVGSDTLGSFANVPVDLSQVYFVSLRRRQEKYPGRWCYYPELEVRL